MHCLKMRSLHRRMNGDDKMAWTNIAYDRKSIEDIILFATCFKQINAWKCQIWNISIFLVEWMDQLNSI